MSRKASLITVSLLLLVALLVLTAGACAKAPAPAPAPAPVPAPAPKPAEVITLKLGTGTNMRSAKGEYVKAWAQTLEERSGGKVKVEILGDAVLGPFDKYYDMLVSGSIDISETPPGHVPGRFPLIDVASLPFTAPDAMVASRAVQALYEMDKDIQAQFQEVKVLNFGAVTLRHVTTIKNPVNKLEDLAGLKFRAPDQPSAAKTKLLGAVPVTMPVSDVYTSLQRGVLDGGLFEWSFMVAFKVTEVVKYATPLHMSTMASATHMNIKKFNSLPPDIQKAIMSMSGDFGAQLFGKIQEDAEERDFNKTKAAGVQIAQLSPQEKERFVKAVTPQWETWVKDMEAKGKPGKRIFDEWTQAVAKFSK